jgi:hypothetical protein
MIEMYDSGYRWPKGSPRESGANEWEGLTQLHLTFIGLGIVFSVYSASQEASRNPASRRGFDFQEKKGGMLQ